MQGNRKDKDMLSWLFINLAEYFKSLPMSVCSQRCL